ncbi:MAG: polysaccharide biosynthesis tyrosine autokinase [Pseudomonadota bacterium]
MNNLPTSSGALMPRSDGVLPAFAQPQYGYHIGYDQPHNDGGFDLVKLFYRILKYRWMVAAFILAGIIGGIVFTYMQTPQYRATTSLEIVTSGAKVFSDFEVVGQASDFRVYETAREKMLSRDLAARVAFKLNLANNETFLAPAPSFSFFNIFRRIFNIDNTADLDELTPEQRQRYAQSVIRGGTEVSLVRNTSILQLSFSHPDPALSAEVANELARSYIDQFVDQTSETSELARQFIAEKVAEAKIKLQDSEKELVEYAQQERITLTGDDVSLITSNIVEINRALSEAIQERLASESINQQINEGASASLPDVFKSDSISKTKLSIAELSARYQEKLSTLKPNFPEMKQLQAQITELRNQVNAEVAALARSEQIKLEQIKVKEASLRSELAQLEAQQSIFQEKNIQYTILKREVDSNRKQYDALVDKLNEVGIGSEIKSSNASIVDAATRPSGPFSPRLSINVLSFVALSIFLVGLAIYIFELLNNTFTTPDQVESELNTPVLGIIPLVEDPLDTNPQSKVSEAFRTLRTSVQFTGTDTTLKTILVTSSEPSEAKTTVAFRLAEGYAALGRKVLVIDADMRKPRMHRLLNLENGMGLSNLLANVVPKGQVVDIFKDTHIPGVSFLSAGTIVPNPADLLASNRMSFTLHFCAKKFDLIIVDSPPVMGLSDAPILSRLVDGTLYVVSSRQVTKKAAVNASERLRNAGASIIGAVLTKFDAQNLDYKYEYKYMQQDYYEYALPEPKKPFLALGMKGGKEDRSDGDNPRGFFAVFFNRFLRRSA